MKKEIVWMTIKEIAAVTGKQDSSVRNILHKMGIKPEVVGRDPRPRYPVTKTFLEVKSKDIKSATHVTIDDIAREAHVSSTTVRKKFKKAGIEPEETGLCRRFIYKYDPSLIDLVRQPLPRVVRKPSVEKLVNPEDFGDAAPILIEEREKKAWVGKQGRLVSNGAVYAQGTIESVSCCGAVVAGKQGRLYELQLA